MPEDIVLIDATQALWAEELFSSLPLILLIDCECLDEAESFLAEERKRDNDPFALIIRLPSPQTADGKPDFRNTWLMHMKVRSPQTFIIFVLAPGTEESVAQDYEKTPITHVRVIREGEDTAQEILRILKEKNYLALPQRR